MQQNVRRLENYPYPSTITITIISPAPACYLYHHRPSLCPLNPSLLQHYHRSYTRSSPCRPVDHGADGYLLVWKMTLQDQRPVSCRSSMHMGCTWGRPKTPVQTSVEECYGKHRNFPIFPVPAPFPVDWSWKLISHSNFQFDSLDFCWAFCALWLSAAIGYGGWFFSSAPSYHLSNTGKTQQRIGLGKDQPCIRVAERTDVNVSMDEEDGVFDGAEIHTLTKKLQPLKVWGRV